MQFDLELGTKPWLDLAIGTLEDDAITFTVEVDGAERLAQTVTEPDQWEPLRLDLSEFAGKRVSLSLSAQSNEPGRLAYWGSPVVRHSDVSPERAETSPARAALIDGGASTPQAAILIVADTLRRDHLDAYGYERQTAPTLARLASEGVLFVNDFAQSPWTKPSFPSILSSLYPSTHGMMVYGDLLPLSASTMAESFRSAGYATLHMASNGWGGTPSRLQQGVEVLHDGASLGLQTFQSKTARVYVPRFLDWLETHDDVPFFAVLHFFDPHLNRRPHEPYDAMWSTEESMGEHVAHQRILLEAGAAPGYANEPGIDTPAVEVLARAGIDQEAFITQDIAWYDGSIRGMDAEIDRLLEGLEAKGLADKTLVAFISDHGEELLEHGKIGHGQSAYGELLNVPMLLWWPGVLPAGVEVDEIVESIDLMPTLLQLSGLPQADNIQGQSLLPLLANSDEPALYGWEDRGAFSEMTIGGRARRYAASLVLDDWKLIENEEPIDGLPRYELYDYRSDPLDQVNVANEYPDIVERLAEDLQLRRQWAVNSRIPSDGEIRGGALT